MGRSGGPALSTFFLLGALLTPLWRHHIPTKAPFGPASSARNQKYMLNTKKERNLETGCFGAPPRTLFTPRPRVLLTMDRALRCFLSLHFCVAEFDPKHDSPASRLPVVFAFRTRLFYWIGCPARRFSEFFNARATGFSKARPRRAGHLHLPRYAGSPPRPS